MSDKKVTIEDVAKDSITYTVTKAESLAAKKSKSKTLPTVIFWFVYLAAVIALKIIFKDQIYDLQYMTLVTGGATFAYMGIEYIDSFIKNKQLPSGYGKVENIERYRAFVYIWCFISVGFTLAYFAFGVKSLPHTEAVGIAGILSIEFIAGNKANKVAVTMDGVSKVAKAAETVEKFAAEQESKEGGK